MSDFKNKSMTNKGMELLSKALSGGKLEFTRVEMGSGTFSGDISSVESLVEIKQNLQLTNIVRKGGQVTLSAILRLEDITTEYDWTEIGVYAKGSDEVEVLYMYGYTTNSSFISKDSLNEKLINVTVMVSNVAEVTAVIDSSIVYLTREALQEHNQDVKSHNDIREQIEELKTQIESIDISWESITGKPDTFPPSTHNHDDIYYTETEIDNSVMKINSYGNRVFGNDLNDWKKAGSWQCNSATTNVPVGDGWGTVLIYGEGDRINQIYNSWNYGSTIKYTRNFNAGSWSPWTKINDGGNADTVDGTHAWQIQTLNGAGQTHGTGFLASIQYAKKGDTRFFLGVDGYETSVNHAYNADTVKGMNVAGIINERGFHGVCTRIYDWNTALHNGYYMGTGVANAPNTDWWMGEVISHDASNWVIQRICNFNNTRQWKVRYKMAGTWTAWQNFGGGGAMRTRVVNATGNVSDLPVGSHLLSVTSPNGGCVTIHGTPLNGYYNVWVDGILILSNVRYGSVAISSMSAQGSVSAASYHPIRFNYASSIVMQYASVGNTYGVYDMWFMVDEYV